jgi:hypothetical protein
MGKDSADFMVQFNFSRQESIARTIDQDLQDIQDMPEAHSFA